MSTMSMRRLAALSTGVVIASAAVGSTAIASTHSPVYTHKDSGRTVHLNTGTVFKIRLKTCADCGDSWSWKHRPNHHVIKQLHRLHVVSTVKPPAVGGIAHTVARFKVVGTGTTSLVLVEKGPSGKRIAHFKLTQAPLNY